MAELRSCYEFKARFSPGGPLVRCKWFFVDDGTPHYPGWHAFLPYSQFLQFKNPESRPTSVAETTPDDEGEGYVFQGVPNHMRPKFNRPYSSAVTVNVNTFNAEGEVHGTEAAFLCEPEPDGTYSARVYDPWTITYDEYQALPKCIQDRNPFILQAVVAMSSELLVVEDVEGFVLDAPIVLGTEIEASVTDVYEIECSLAFSTPIEVTFEIPYTLEAPIVLSADIEMQDVTQLELECAAVFQTEVPFTEVYPWEIDARIILETEIEVGDTHGHAIDAPIVVEAGIDMAVTDVVAIDAPIVLAADVPITEESFALDVPLVVETGIEIMPNVVALADGACGDGDAVVVAAPLDLEDGGAGDGDVEAEESEHSIDLDDGGAGDGDVEAIAAPLDLDDGGAGDGDVDVEEGGGEPEPMIHVNSGSPPWTPSNAVWLTDVSSGSFRLKFHVDEADPGEWSELIPWNADAATLEAAIFALSIGAYLTGVTGSGIDSDPWIISYSGERFGIGSTDIGTLAP